MSEYYHKKEDLNHVNTPEQDVETSADELLAIQQEYRRKRMTELLLGPVVSTIFHIVVIVLMAITITDSSFIQRAEIEIEVTEQEPEIEIEEEIENNFYCRRNQTKITSNIKEI